MRLLLAEDEKALSSALQVILKHNNYSVDAVYNGQDAYDYIMAGVYDGVILDVMMPKMDGFTVLSKIRAESCDVPVIMLTAKGTEYDKVLGLDAGADDYVAKPFGMMELLSRIRALLRRTETENGTLRCGILEVDPGQHIVRVRGQETILTQKEFEVLCLLLRNPGQVLSREQLIENVWGYAFTGESRTVDVHVRTLRQKLGEAGAYIETVRGYGYKITDRRAGET